MKKILHIKSNFNIKITIDVVIPHCHWLFLQLFLKFSLAFLNINLVSNKFIDVDVLLMATLMCFS